MADLPQRAEYEAKLAKAVADILAQNKAEWQDGLEPAQTERSLREKLLGLLLLVFTLGAGTAAGELGIALVADGAARSWANSYSAVLARGVVDAVRRRVSRARAKDLLGTGGLVADVVAKVTTPDIWGNFAATEITRANTAGGEFTAMVYNIGRTFPAEQPLPGTFTPDGPAVTPIPLPDGEQPPIDEPQIPEPALAIWHTSRDQRVCPVCRPLHGRARDEWSVQFPIGPPAHIACRCYVDYEVAGK